MRSILSAILLLGLLSLLTSARTPSSIGVSPTGDVIALIAFPSLTIGNPGCSAWLTIDENFQQYWAGCPEIQCATTACASEFEDQGNGSTIRWCDCSGEGGVGCASEITVGANGVVTNVWCYAFYCDECTNTTPPAPLPGGPPVGFRACDCLL